MHVFNIYNLVVVELFTKNKKYVRYFENEYKKMHTKKSKVSKPIKINLHIGKLPEEKNGDIFAKKRFKKLFNFEYLIRGLDQEVIEIYFSKHFIDEIYINAVGVYVQAQILEPIMYYKLLEKGVIFMHAAGVEKNGIGYLMPACGGTGKTTLSLRLVAKGYRLLGDDLLLVDINSGLVCAYPRPFHVFTYNINSLEKAKIPFKYKTIIYIKNVLRWLLETITGDEFLISTRIHADELYPGNIWSTTVPYKRIIFLKKDGVDQTCSLKSGKSIKAHAKNLIGCSDLSESLTKNILFGKKEKQHFTALEQKVIVRLLSGFSNINYVNTRKLSSQELSRYFDDY